MHYAATAGTAIGDILLPEEVQQDDDSENMGKEAMPLCT